MKTRDYSLLERAELAKHPLATRLLSLLLKKKSNLCLSADLTKKEELLSLADELGPHISVLKTHIDILEDFDPHFPQRLRRVADRHNFLLFEDRKFADIGNTVVQQYRDGLYRIVEWADIVNAHILPGPGIIEGLRSVGLSEGRGLLLLAEMSSSGNLAKGAYAESAIEWAQEYSDFVLGFITQTRFSNDPGMVHMTPGIKLDRGGDSLGQQYNTPEYVLGELGSDIAIVGRGILKANQRISTAQEYQQRCWKALKSRLPEKAAQ